MNKIDEIVNDLPNGFHDSRLKSIFIDYESDKIILMLDVWVGDLHDPNKEMRDKYVPGELEFYKIQFFISEPPRVIAQSQIYNKIFIDIEGIESLPKEQRSKLPKFKGNDSFAAWIYINNSNSFIFISAKSAKFNFDLPGEKTN